MEWETEDGAVYGYSDDGVLVIEISALQSRAEAVKWGEPYTPGREWFVTLPDGKIVSGRSSDLRKAKREALACLEGLE